MTNQTGKTKAPRARTPIPNAPLGGGPRDVRVSFIAAGLVTIYSVLALAFGDLVYPDPHLWQTFRPNDAISLIIGVPALFLGLQWRAHLGGFLLWAGALLFFSYNSLVAVLSFPVGPQLLIQLAIVLLSAGTVIRLLARTTHLALLDRLGGKVGELFTGGVLTLFGLGFAARAISTVFFSGADVENLPQSEIALLMTDTLFGLLWGAAGIMLALRRPSGYAFAGTGLVQAMLLFVALILFLIIKPGFDGTAFQAENLVTVLIMALLFGVPVGIFIRGVTQTR